MTAEEAEGNTVEAELLKRSGRKSRKFARMLKRRARQTERMASELEANAEASFNWVSRGYRSAPFHVDCLSYTSILKTDGLHPRTILRICEMPLTP